MTIKIIVKMKKIILLCLILGFFSCQKEEAYLERLDKLELANALGVKEECLHLDEKTKDEFEKNGGVYLKFKTLEEAKKYLSEAVGVKKTNSLKKDDFIFDSILKKASTKKVKLVNRVSSSIAYFGPPVYEQRRGHLDGRLVSITYKIGLNLNADFSYVISGNSISSVSDIEFYLSGLTYGYKYKEIYTSCYTSNYNIYLKNEGVLMIGIDIGGYVRILTFRVEAYGSYTAKFGEYIPIVSPNTLVAELKF